MAKIKINLHKAEQAFEIVERKKRKLAKMLKQDKKAFVTIGKVEKIKCDMEDLEDLEFVLGQAVFKKFNVFDVSGACKKVLLKIGKPLTYAKQEMLAR